MLEKSNVVLVVDDSPSFREFVTTILRQELCFENILEADSANDALQILEQAEDKIDWIFSDWEMPGMSGHEFLMYVRKRPELVNVPFIMLTGRDDISARSLAVREGVTDYLSKPFTSDVLVRKVRRLMGLEEQRRSQRFEASARVIVDIGFDNYEKYVADLVNISRHGCLVRTPQFNQAAGFVFDIGDVLIEPPGDEPFHLKAEIVRVERDPSIRKHVQVAFDFHNTDEDNTMRLQRFLEHAEKNASRKKH